MTRSNKDWYGPIRSIRLRTEDITSQGQLSISWTVDQPPDAGGLKLDWRERGGPLVIHPKDKGFGHIVIKDMIEQAVRGSVELDFAEEGLHWSLQAPAGIFLR